MCSSFFSGWLHASKNPFLFSWRRPSKFWFSLNKNNLNQHTRIHSHPTNFLKILLAASLKFTAKIRLVAFPLSPPLFFVQLSFYKIDCIGTRFHASLLHSLQWISFSLNLTSVGHQKSPLMVSTLKLVSLKEFHQKMCPLAPLIYTASIILILQ